MCERKKESKKESTDSQTGGETETEKKDMGGESPQREREKEYIQLK